MKAAIVNASDLKDSLSARDVLADPRIPKKWVLLPENHPTVLRRLVKELNSQANGFYFNGERYNRARYSNGHIVVSMCGEDHATLLDYTISDPYGNLITASRTTCGH